MNWEWAGLQYGESDSLNCGEEANEFIMCYV